MTQITDFLSLKIAIKECILWIWSHWVHYPTGRDEMVNFVAIEKNPKWSEESWKVEGAKTDFLKSFAGWNDDQFPWLCLQKDSISGVSLMSLPKTLYNGRALLGDAAHPMVPFLGQGGCLAIEDAYCLSALINQVTDPKRLLVFLMK